MSFPVITKLTELPGISKDAVEGLKLLGITSVSELAASQAFANAVKLVSVGTANHVVMTLPLTPTPLANLVKKSEVGFKTLREVLLSPIKVLQGIPDAHAAKIAVKLNIDNVRDLSVYPPYHSAKGIIHILDSRKAAAYGTEEPAAVDLIPKSGEYAIENVEYTTLLLGDVKSTGTDSLADINDPDFFLMDLTKVPEPEKGFKRVVYGALLSFNQSWFSHGVTLGQLLHSVTLAPGESTRVAVVDWSRHSRASQTEEISEKNALTNDSSNKRAVNEITNSVAKGSQSGFSLSLNNSSSKQTGTSSALEIPGLFGKSLVSGGSSNSSSSSNSRSTGYATSAGTRSVSANMLQNALNLTHQVAHHSRDRRASVVKEIFQSEHEEASTRVITNYNHMHALSVQYYEVIQVYRVEVTLKRADKVIFIPFKPLDIVNPKVLLRFRDLLAPAALTSDMRMAMRVFNTIEMSLVMSTNYLALNDPLDKALECIQNFSDDNVTDAEKFVEMLAFDVYDPNTLDRATAYRLLSKSLWRGVLEEVSEKNQTPLLNTETTSLFLPPDAKIVKVDCIPIHYPPKVHFYSKDGQVHDPSQIPLSYITSITLSCSTPERIRIELHLDVKGSRSSITLPWVRYNHYDNSEVRVIDVKSHLAISPALKKHLEANHDRYRQVILRSLDSTQTASLLSGYKKKVDGQFVPLASVVNPVPVGSVGNLLAFKFNTGLENDAWCGWSKQTTTEDDAWSKWLKKSGIDMSKPETLTKKDFIPLGTGGVFAEGVLGRSNCAEKLDITRFWNWQDSPLPPGFGPGDIAPITVGSRARNDDITPGQLSKPIINITQPAALPDPTGMNSVLAAVGNGNMFHDMSGLAGIMSLNETAIKANKDGALNAGQYATANMQNLLQANTERYKATTEMVTQLADTAASVYTARGTSSDDGAKINHLLGQSSGSSEDIAAGVTKGQEDIKVQEETKTEEVTKTEEETKVEGETKAEEKTKGMST